MSVSGFSQERASAVLKRNTLVNGSEQIATKLLEAGEIKSFSNGTELIKQGDSDDCAYFILSGDVSVLINGVQRDTRRAPDSVGELSAADPVHLRTATVVVSSTEMVACKVCGEKFRAIMKSSKGFGARLTDYSMKMLRDRLSEYAPATGSPRHLIWVACSIVVGLIIAGSSFWGLAHVGVVGPLQPAISTLAGLISFFLVMVLNPAFFYKRAITTVLAGAFFGPASFGIRFDEEFSFHYVEGHYEPWMLGYYLFCFGLIWLFVAKDGA